MRYKLKLDLRDKEKRKDGYPSVVFLFHEGKQKKITLGLNFEKSQWNFDKNEPKSDKRKILFIREKKLLLDKLMLESIENHRLTLDQVKIKLLNKEGSGSSQSFYDYAEEIIGQLSQKKDQKGFEKKGNVRVYENAVKQLKIFRDKLDFSEFDYSLWNDFSMWQQRKGNGRSTIATYLKVYRAIYNEAVRNGLVEDTKPFKHIFRTVSVKRNRTKKRHISKESIKILENIEGLPKGQQTAVDLWLLQFYLGGQDFKDIYFLENSQFSNGRVYLTRGKLDEDGYEFDLKIFSKVQKIIDKYKQEGRFVFPWRKDYKGYTAFIRRVQRNLVTVQKKQDEIAEITNDPSKKIEVLPMGGNLSPKVSRHTFATLGRYSFVEPDLLRALMGHERNDVDTIYKDSYLEKDRDHWHWKIIGTEK